MRGRYWTVVQREGDLEKKTTYHTKRNTEHLNEHWNKGIWIFEMFKT